MNYEIAISEFYFTLKRETDWNQYIVPMKTFSTILHSLKSDISRASTNESLTRFIHYMILLYKMIGYTRDIYYGKGEQDLTYMMIYIWYQYFPLPALHILHMLPQFLDIESKENLPYGSWKDIGRFCKFVRHFSKFGDKDPLIEHAIGLLNHQIDVDSRCWIEVSESWELASKNPMRLVDATAPRACDHISLACKWTPREGSSLGWLFDRCVIQWVRSIKPHYFKFIRDETQFQRVFRKAKCEYRKMVSGMTRAWDLPQIKQCAKDWKAISPESVSSKTLHNNRRAFLNVDSQGNTRYVNDNDRIVCGQRFENYFGNDFLKDGSGSGSGSDVVKMYGSTECLEKKYYNIDLCSFFRSVFYKSVNLSEQCYLQKVWGKLLNQTIDNHCCQQYFLPILDLSLYGSDGFHQGIGISAILSHVSSIGRRMIAYDTSPSWIDMDGFKTNIIDIVDHIRGLASEKHIGSNLLDSIEFILHFLIESETSVEDMSRMVFVFISDFSNIDNFNETHGKIIDGFTRHQITEANMPRFVYWNVGGNGNGGGSLENLSTEKALVINGCSFSVIQHLCSVTNWDTMNNWGLLSSLLSHPRYNVLENYIHELLSKSKVGG